MSVILIISIAIRVLGLGWSLLLWWRVRDWRMGFLAAMFVLMAIRQSGTLMEELVERAESRGLDTWGIQEIPGLIVSLLGLLAVVFLERLLIERQRQAAALRSSNERYQELSKTQKMLFNELDHRVRNNLAGLLGLVQMGRQSATDVKSFSEALANRIMAMKSVHELIANSEWRGADLRALLENLSRQVIPECEKSSRIRFTGPNVPVRSRQAGALAMIIQELLTNSSKYGAIATPTGTADAKWEIIEEDETSLTLRFRWCETGFHAPTPSRKGMGLQLVRGFAKSDFAGDCTFDFGAGGFRCELLLHVEKGPPVNHADIHTGLTTVT